MNNKTQNIVLIIASATILFGIVATTTVLIKAHKVKKSQQG